MSDDKPKQPVANSQPIRIRSRFPKAQPNIAISSGIARIRRLSGHFSSNEQETSNNESQLQQSPAKQPSTPTQSLSIAPLSARHLIDNVLSPKIPQTLSNESERPTTPKKNTHQHQDENLSLTITNNNSPASPLTFRQLINQNSNNLQTIGSPGPNHYIHSVTQPGTPIVLVQHEPSALSSASSNSTNSLAAYTSQFTKEHIMNIIKYKAMQKLKKIESDALKEKRKKYKQRNNSLLNKQLSNTNKQCLTNATESNLLDENTNLSQTTSTSTTALLIDKSKLRMRDFLYYSPRNSHKKSESNSNEIIVENGSIQNDVESTLNRSASNLSILNSENDTNDTTIESISSKSSNELLVKSKQLKPVEPQARIIAPQLKIAEDGTIVINEESLVIQREHHEPVFESTVVEGEQIDNLTYNSYRKFHHTKKWTERETAKFYKALSMVGTDFTMIQKFFSHRNRDEIKRKFKREEKLNQALIDKILSKTSQIDLSIFVSSSSDDEDCESLKSNEQNKRNKKMSNKNETKIEQETGSDSSKKKQKLKRIQKRAFIESESDDSNKNKNANKKPYLKESKQFVNTDESNELNPDDESKLSSSHKENEQFKLDEQNKKEKRLENTDNKLPPCTSLFNLRNENSLIINEQFVNSELVVEEKKQNSLVIENESKEDQVDKSEDEEGIELIFDLDNNLVKIKNDELNKNVYKEIDDYANDDDEENIILDLDNNLIIRQTNSNQIDEPCLVEGTKSSISITRIDKNIQKKE